MKNETEKRCTHCGVTQPVAKFYVYMCRGRRTRSSHCRKCSNAVAKAWSTSPRGRERNRVTRLKRRLRDYGVTEAWFDEQVKRQNGVCAICGKTEYVRRTNVAGRLHIDHCHRTGQPRGLLCGKCNTAIGLLGDDLGTVRGAFDYTLKWAMQLMAVPARSSA